MNLAMFRLREKGSSLRCTDESFDGISNILPLLLAADFIIPFLLAPSDKGYHHLTQVMSVLGNAKAPLHLIYNIWLVVFGIFIVVSAIQLYPEIAKVSGTIAILLLSVLLIYAIGGCILSGIFSVGETKSLDTASEKIHGYGSVIGFLLLTFAPLFIGVYFWCAGSDGTAGCTVPAQQKCWLFGA